MVSVTFWGCATSNVSSDYAMDASNGEGLVVMSISQDLNQRGKSKFYFDSGEDFLLLPGAIMVGATEPGFMGMGTKKTEISDVQGRLMVVTMAAGEHNLNYWQVEVPGGRLHPEHQPKPYSFQVKVGEVKYLGNLHMNFASSKNLLGISSVSNAVPEIRHEFSRDKALFEQRYPQFSKRLVNNPLPKGVWIQSPE